MQPDNAELITIDEMCEMLMIGRTTAYKLLRSGTLKVFKLGKVWKIPKASVIELINERRYS